MGSCVLVLFEGNIASRSDGKPRVFVFEHKRTCGAEAKAANIGCLGRNIRGPQVHVPPSNHNTIDLSSVEKNETD